MSFQETPDFLLLHASAQGLISHHVAWLHAAEHNLFWSVTIITITR